jgi:hypothetical protein
LWREPTQGTTGLGNFTRCEEKAEYYLGMVQFSCWIVTYRKIVLGWAPSPILNLKENVILLRGWVNRFSNNTFLPLGKIIL